MSAPYQGRPDSSGRTTDSRRYPRFKLEVNMTIKSKSCGLLEGWTVDISESGISAMLKLEVPLDEVVELKFTAPYGPVTVYAVVRQRSAFRYGFQFVESEAARRIIQATCQSLAIEQRDMSSEIKDDSRKNSTNP